VVRAPDGKGFLPSGLSIICGDPGAGKSTLVRAMLACLTTGNGAFQAEKGEVLFLCWEDDEASLVLPHLLSCGGDPRAAHMVRGVQSDIGQEAAFQPVNLGLVREHLEANPSIRMVVVDVLSTMTALGGRDSDKGEDIRGLLDPMHKLGLELGVSILVLHHQNKRTGEGALTRVSGSIQISGTARLVWVVAPDPDDSTIRRVALVKGNVPGRTEHGFGFKEEPVDRLEVTRHAANCGVDIPPELEEDVFRKVEIVDGLTPISANDLSKGASQQGKETAADKAEEWLRSFLAKHGEALDKAVSDAAKSEGIGRNALWDAKREMKEAGLLRTVKRGASWWLIATTPEGANFDDVFCV